MKRVLVVAALLAGVLASSATAYRSPTASERRQIIAAILLSQQQHDCQSTRTCRPQISGIRVSLANTSFATADLWVPRIGGALALLHRQYGTWRVTDTGSAFVGCGGKAPKMVRVDLTLTCPYGK
jgi:hypothetical protein